MAPRIPRTGINLRRWIALCDSGVQVGRERYSWLRMCSDDKETQSAQSGVAQTHNRESSQLVDTHSLHVCLEVATLTRASESVCTTLAWIPVAALAIVSLGYVSL